MIVIEHITSTARIAFWCDYMLALELETVAFLRQIRTHKEPQA